MEKQRSNKKGIEVKKTLIDTKNKILQIDDIDKLAVCLKMQYKERESFKYLKFPKKFSDIEKRHLVFIEFLKKEFYSQKDSEILYETLLIMPKSVLNSLYDLNAEKKNLKLKIKNSKINIPAKTQQEKRESFLKWIGIGLKGVDIAANIFGTNRKNIKLTTEIQEKQDRINFLEDLIQYEKNQLRKLKNRLGKYNELFQEIDDLIEKNENVSGFQKKDAILIVMNKHLEIKDNQYLNELYERCKKNFLTTYERFKSTYYTNKKDK